MQIRNHRKVYADVITKTLIEFDLENEFSSTNGDHNVTILNQTILNKLRNFIPHETVLFNDRVSSWFNNKINLLIRLKNNISKLTK